MASGVTEIDSAMIPEGGAPSGSYNRLRTGSP